MFFEASRRRVGALQRFNVGSRPGAVGPLQTYIVCRIHKQQAKTSKDMQPDPSNASITFDGMFELNIKILLAVASSMESCG